MPKADIKTQEQQAAERDTQRGTEAIKLMRQIIDAKRTVAELEAQLAKLIGK